jgi:hypothetical protein
MTGSDFLEQCWNCKTIRQHICDASKRRSRIMENQEDYVQEAWLAISTIPHCEGIDACKELVNSAIYSGYWQQNKERLMLKTVDLYGVQNQTPERITDNDPDFMKDDAKRGGKQIWRK